MAMLSRCLLLTVLISLISTSVSAFEIEEWRVQTSLYTKHWSNNPEHVNNTQLIGIEFVTPKKWIGGFAYFQNSFGQPSEYLYVGYSWDLFHKDWFYFKLTAGLLHGYKDEFKDKIPFNGLGIAPAAVPSFGVRYKRGFAELQILGGAAITITAGLSFGGNKYKKSD